MLGPAGSGKAFALAAAARAWEEAGYLRRRRGARHRHGNAPRPTAMDSTGRRLRDYLDVLQWGHVTQAAALMAHGVLPRRDKHLAHFERWAAHRLETVAHAEDRAAITAYVRWHPAPSAASRRRHR